MLDGRGAIGIVCSERGIRQSLRNQVSIVLNGRGVEADPSVWKSIASYSKYDGEVIFQSVSGSSEDWKVLF
jgi:hypothetical protein